MKFLETNNKLEAKAVFNSFREAVAFIMEVSLIAEKVNHHPRIINEYNKVEIILTTHDAGNIVSDKDLNLAREIEAISIKYL
jgi:4a-hydroxytetrahydrobiopterin dehydratase